MVEQSSGRLTSLLEHVRPEDHESLQRTQVATTKVLQQVLEKQCPLDIAAVLPHGPSGRGTMVKRYQEDLDLLVLMGGCVGSGSHGYLSALLDLLMEFCKTQFANHRDRGHCTKFQPSNYYVSFVWNHSNGEKQTVKLWPAPVNGGDALLQNDHPQWYSIGLGEHCTDIIARESQVPSSATALQSRALLMQCSLPHPPRLLHQTFLPSRL